MKPCELCTIHSICEKWGITKRAERKSLELVAQAVKFYQQNTATSFYPKCCQQISDIQYLFQMWQSFVVGTTQLTRARMSIAWGRFHLFVSSTHARQRHVTRSLAQRASRSRPSSVSRSPSSPTSGCHCCSGTGSLWFCPLANRMPNELHAHVYM